MAGQEHTTAVVAGGGPAGMVAGLLLARAGVPVTVLEKHGDFLRDFRGDTVHPTTLRLLDELGLGPRFRTLPTSWADRVELPAPDGGRVVVGDLRMLPLPKRYRRIAMVPQWDLLNLLADAGRAEPSFTLRMNTEATGVLREEGHVTGVRYRTADGRVGELRADLTIAADGRGSTLRDAIGLRPHEYRVPMDTWWFRLSRHEGDTQGGLTAQADGADLAVTINRGDYFQIAYFTRKGGDGELRAEGLERFRARVARVLPSLADRVDEIESLDDVKLLDVKLDRLRRWYTDGLLCVGDAAHAMSPVGGVGINLAIQDAVAAATMLAAPLLRGEVRTAQLAAVQRRRVAPTVVIQALQRFLHRVVVEPTVTGRRVGALAKPIGLLRAVPALRVVPAYLIGVGIRPERAPAFARR